MKILLSLLGGFLAIASAEAMEMAEYRVEVQFVNGAGNTPDKEIGKQWHCSSSVKGTTTFQVPTPNGKTHPSARQLKFEKETNLASPSVRTDSFKFAGPHDILPNTEFFVTEQCLYPDSHLRTDYVPNAKGGITSKTTIVNDDKIVRSIRRCHARNALKVGESARIECSSPKMETVDHNNLTDKVKDWLSRRSASAQIQAIRVYRQVLYSNCQASHFPPRIIRLTGGLTPRSDERNLYVDLSVNGSKPFRLNTVDGNLYGDIEWCGPEDSLNIAVRGGKKGLVFRDDYDPTGPALIGRGSQQVVVNLNRRLWLGDFLTPKSSAIGLELLPPAKPENEEAAAH